MSNASDFIIENGILKKYVGPGGDVVIPDGVTEIGNAAFIVCEAVTSVVIPEGVTRIGWVAFSACSCLKSISLPDSITSIEESAFDNCRTLECISVPSGVVNIGKGAFKNCCKVIFHHWDRSFASALSEGTDVTIMDDVVPITEFPTKMRKKALLWYAAGKIQNKEHNAEKTYHEYAKKNAIVLCQDAFKHPKLLRFLCSNKLIDPKDVDVYAEKAGKCEDPEIRALILNYQHELGSGLVSAREQKEKEQETYLDALTERVSVRDSSKGIAGMTFVIDTDLYWWGDESQGKIRKKAKEYLDLHGAKLGTTITKKTDYLVANSANKSSPVYNKAVDWGVPIITEDEFNRIVKKKYENASEIIVPDWIKWIPDDAFIDCDSLTKVMLPDGVMGIGDSAFARCSKLKKIAVPETVRTIGDSAFRGCRGLANKDGYIIINNILCGYCGKSKDLIIPEGVVEIAKGALKKNQTITSVTIPKGIASIGDNAFEKCKKLEKAIIPGSVVHIGDGTFDGCTHLREVDIEEGVETIGEKAFQWCDMLNVIIPGSVSNIGPYCFKNCRSLNNVVIHESVKQIGKEAFADIGNSTCAYLPKSIASIGAGNFQDYVKPTIYAPAGSYAEWYAKENNIPFVAE